MMMIIEEVIDVDIVEQGCTTGIIGHAATQDILGTN